MLLYVSIQVLLAAIVVVSFFRGRRSVLWTVGFLAPLGGLSFALGVNWAWPKFIPWLLVAELAIRGGWSRVRRLPAGGLLLGLLAYVALLTVALGLVDEETIRRVEWARSFGWGPAQTTYRHAIQFAVSLGLWGTPALVFATAANPQEALAVQEGFIRGAILSVAIGGYQVLAQVSGLPWFDPAELAELASGNLGLRERLQEFSLGEGRTVVRLYGLGGEPKHTAAYCVYALAVLVARATTRQRISSVSAASLLVGLGLTFSTSGWVAALALAVVALAFIGLKETIGAARLGVAVVAVVAVVSFVSASALRAIVEERVQERMGGGLSSIAGAEFKDGAYLDFLAQRPVRAAIGAGSGGIDFYLVDFVPSAYLRANATITPTYFPIRLAGEAGALGLLLLFLVFRRWLRAGGSPASLERRGLILVIAGVLILPSATLGAALLLAGSFLAQSGQATQRAVDQRSAVAR